MADDRWVLRVYNRHGDLMERTERRSHGAESWLRDLGMVVTSMRGQLSWRCDLYRDGVCVATCKRGVWREVRQ